MLNTTMREVLDVLEKALSLYADFERYKIYYAYDCAHILLPRKVERGRRREFYRELLLWEVMKDENMCCGIFRETLNFEREFEKELFSHL